MNYSEIRAEARAILKNNWGTAFVCMLIYSLLVGAVSNMVPLLSFVIGGPLAYGLVALYLGRARGTRMDVNTLFAGFNRFVDTLVLGLLQGLFVFLWSLLFVIPGVIKSYSYAMAFYIMHDEPGIKPMEALRKSEEMMKGYKGSLFGLQLSFIGWWLLIIVTLGLASFFVAPYMQAATAIFYQRLRGEATVLEENSAAAHTPPVQAAESVRMGLFTGMGGGLAGIAYSLPDGAEYSVGSDPAQCAIVAAASESIAGRHCTVSYQAADDTYRITDHSETGVCVCGVRIPAGEVQIVVSGSEVTLGEGTESFRLG
ncbi:MAG: DUF975 family protein [Oscillospiraceae bacterium]|nr:DUF975 family protein [Oscillospiraceae bacterium]